MKVLWVVSIFSLVLWSFGCSNPEPEPVVQEEPVEGEVFNQDFENGEIEEMAQESGAEESVEGAEKLDFEEGSVESATE